MDYAAIAKKIPFTLTLSMACEGEHGLLYMNKDLNIVMEIVTKVKKNNTFGEPKTTYYVNEKYSDMYRNLRDLLRANPLISKLAYKKFGGPKLLKDTTRKAEHI